MGRINDPANIADVMVYRIQKCWECPFHEGATYCPYYQRHIDEDTDKPEWCRVVSIKIEFGR